MNSLGFLPIAKGTDSNANFGGVFTQPFQVNFKARPIGHFTLDDPNEGIMFFGFGRQFQLFYRFDCSFPCVILWGRHNFA